MHTPRAWNPRLNNPVTISRMELEGLLDASDALQVTWLLLALQRRIRLIEDSNLGFMAKIERLMPLEEMVVRLIVIRRALDLYQEASDLLQALEDDDAADQLRRLDISKRPAPSRLPPS
jgi:hypothetical protein